MEGLWLSVGMVSTLYIQLWLGETGHLARAWNLFGHQMGNMLLEKAPQRLRFSVKISRLVSFYFYILHCLLLAKYLFLFGELVVLYNADI